MARQLMRAAGLGFVDTDSLQIRRHPLASADS